MKENISKEPNPDSGNRITTKEKISRWGLFIALTWLEFGIGYNWLVQFAIKDHTESYFKIAEDEKFKYRLLGTSWYLSLFLSNFVGTVQAKKFFRFNVFFGWLLISAGTIIKYYVTSDYGLSMTANIIAALCQGFIYPAPASLATRFFPRKLQSYIIAVPPFFTTIGCALGLWFPQYLLPDRPFNLDTINENMDKINLLGIFCCVPALLFIIPSFFVKMEPVNDNYSRTTEEIHSDYDILNEDQESSQFKFERQALLNSDGCEELGWFDSYAIQMNNKNCFFNFLAGSQFTSIWWVFLTASADTLDDFGMKDYAALICQLYILVGAMASIFLVQFFDHQRYRGIKINLLISSVALMTLIVLNYYRNDSSTGSAFYKNTTVIVILVVVYVICGTIFPTLLGLYLNFCVDISAPASESLTTGNIIAYSVLFSFIITEVISVIELYKFVLLLAQMVIVAIISFYGMQEKNQVTNYNQYFCKKCMVKRKIFREKKLLDEDNQNKYCSP